MILTESEIVQKYCNGCRHYKGDDSFTTFDCNKKRFKDYKLLAVSAKSNGEHCPTYKSGGVKMIDHLSSVIPAFIGGRFVVEDCVQDLSVHKAKDVLHCSDCDYQSPDGKPCSRLTETQMLEKAAQIKNKKARDCRKHS